MQSTKERVKRKTKKNNLSLLLGLNCTLTLNDAKSVSEGKRKIELSQDACSEMKKSNVYLQRFVQQRVPVYGVNTQFGDQVTFLDDHLKSNDSALYYDSINNRQANLIKSHNCGLGHPVSSNIIRVAMLLRIHCLAQGVSGVHLNVVRSLMDCLNAGIVPRVPQYGSIGASGDLIPLATIAGALIGENVEVEYQGQVMRAPEALALANLKPLKPEMRDGLALINGTSFMTAIASLSLYALKRLFPQMLAAIGMTLEALMVITSAYDPWVHRLKRHLGQQAINQFFIAFWQGSKLLSKLEDLRMDCKLKHKKNAEPPIKSVQDYYSLRSVAQGFGPFYENLEQAIVWIENEMNSVNDNPIVNVNDKQIHHVANFMGYYVTDACDILKMNIGQASTWLHALLANLVHPRKNHHLPANLVKHPETNNGFRPLQLLAASLAVQNRKLAQSQQAYSLPTEGDNQDVNSLGTHAALDFQESVDNLERLTAILLLAATQALEFRGIKSASRRSQEIYQIVRAESPSLRECRVMHHELNQVILLLREEKI